MNVWWCNQSISWDVEYKNRVVRASADAENNTYRKTVGLVKEGDITVHYRQYRQNKKLHRYVLAFSYALKEGCWKKRLRDGYGEGWEFPAEYYVLKIPIERDAFRDQLIKPKVKGFPLDKNKNVRQGYFFPFNLENLAIIVSHLSPQESVPYWLTDLSDYNSKVDGDISRYMLERAEYRLHVRYERIRNQQLASEAKRAQGYVCQICNFDFEKCYGEMGKGYIEAHHIVPFNTLDPEKDIPLSPKEDFAVVCSNCHSMLHRKPYPTVNELRDSMKGRK